MKAQLVVDVIVTIAAIVVTAVIAVSAVDVTVGTEKVRSVVVEQSLLNQNF
jgi:hypothetical protein